MWNFKLLHVLVFLSADKHSHKNAPAISGSDHVKYDSLIDINDGAFDMFNSYSGGWSPSNIYISMMMLWHWWPDHEHTIHFQSQFTCLVVHDLAPQWCHNIIINIYIAPRSATWIKIKHIKGSVIDVDKTVIFHMIWMKNRSGQRSS